MKVKNFILKLYIYIYNELQAPENCGEPKNQLIFFTVFDQQWSNG